MCKFVIEKEWNCIGYENFTELKMKFKKYTKINSTDLITGYQPASGINGNFIITYYTIKAISTFV